MNLEKQDLAVIGGGLLVSFIAAFAAEAQLISSSLVSAITGLLPRITLVVILAGVAFVYLSRDLLGGEVVRRLEVIAVGFLIYAVIWWPHKIWWHGSGMGGEMPGWLFFSPGAWQTFFHLLTASAIATTGYGFYLFWKMAEEG
jgi:hypothetical protein